MIIIRGMSNLQKPPPTFEPVELESAPPPPPLPPLILGGAEE